ncbi:MAG: FliI/YscN family ATPase [Planctomycetota bacterium]
MVATTLKQPRSTLASHLRSVADVMPLRVVGQIAAVSGLTLEADNLPLPLGTTCRISRMSDGFAGASASPCRAQVVGFGRDPKGDARTLLMPLGDIGGVAAGDSVEGDPGAPRIRCGEGLLGRVVNGFGDPIDDKGPITSHSVADFRPLDAPPIPPMGRALVREPLTTGVRAVDALLTCGTGQRMGLFAGPGVGKSTLLSWISRHTSADVSVIALIGERGREVREFLESGLAEGALERCVVVVCTADEPPLMKIRAAKTACCIAEHFRDHGKDVLLMMDSITRLCQAQRQIGLAAKEPPATKGFPPSVFAMLPTLLERAGSTGDGSVTGFYTVLVEGDDFNEPIPDAVKGITDGHLWLDRSLAERGHYPAIDVLKSVSRVRSDVSDKNHVDAASLVQKAVADYAEVEDLVNVGAYVPGSNVAADTAVAVRQQVTEFLQQTPDQPTNLDSARHQLFQLRDTIRAAAHQASQPQPARRN